MAVPLDSPPHGSHLVESGADRAPIRVGGDHVAYQALHARWSCCYVRGRAPDADGEMVLAVKSGATEVNGLSSMRAPQAHGAVLALPPVASSERPLHESKQPRLAALRGRGIEFRFGSISEACEYVM